MTNENIKNARLTKAATVLTKLLEVGYSIMAVGLTVGLIMFALDRAGLAELVQGEPEIGQTLTVHGFSIGISNPDGSLNNTAVIIFLITGALVAELMAWVFRNTNLILRTSQGETKFSKGNTFFQKDNVRMLREIGIFFIAITVVQFVMSAIAVMLLGLDNAELSVGMQNIVMGLLMLCLSLAFAQGEQMQKDVDGLV